MLGASRSCMWASCVCASPLVLISFQLRSLSDGFYAPSILLCIRMWLGLLKPFKFGFYALSGLGSFFLSWKLQNAVWEYVYVNSRPLF